MCFYVLVNYPYHAYLIMFVLQCISTKSLKFMLYVCVCVHQEPVLSIGENFNYFCIVQSIVIVPSVAKCVVVLVMCSTEMVI